MRTQNLASDGKNTEKRRISQVTEKIAESSADSAFLAEFAESNQNLTLFLLSLF
ncbi:hypothetical protein ACWIUD_09520 [Helicobacter sp. 23-1044]